MLDESTWGLINYGYTDLSATRDRGFLGVQSLDNATPTHKFSTMLVHHFSQSFLVSLSHFISSSARWRDASINQPGYSSTDIKLLKRFTQSNGNTYGISLTIKNLFDNEYFEYQDGNVFDRQYYLKLDAEL